MSAFHSQAALANLVRKADVMVSDMQTDGGYLLDEQARKFIRKMIKVDQLQPLLTARSTLKPSYSEPKIGFTGSVLRPGQENRALTEAERVSPDFEDESYTPEEFVAECRFGRKVLEDNIEGNTLRDVIMQELTKAAGRDLGRVILQGDTSGTPGSYLSVIDGLIKQTTSNLVVAGGVALDQTTLKAMFKAMEAEYLDKSKAIFFTSKDAEEDYRSTIATRQTANGDTAFGSVPANSQPMVAYGGVRVMPLQLMPEDLGGGSETVVLLFDPKNAITVYRRDILIETDYDVSSKQWIVVMSMRMTVGWIEELAAAKATGISVA